MSSPSGPELVLVANARMPSQRAQSLQVAQASAAFERAGMRTTLLHPRRTHTPSLPPGQDIWDYYDVPPGPRPRITAVACADWIDRLPRALQFWPARVQELTFARNAARRVRIDHPHARILSREIEAANSLRNRAGLFLEVHRVPGGAARRSWLVRASAGASGILAISGGVRADLLELGVPEAKLHVEHDAFEARRFAGLPERAAARELLGLQQDTPLIVYTGALLPWKGVDTLVGAARRLPDLRFVVAGGMDADVARLRAFADGLPNLRVDGFQPPSRVPLYLAAADVGVVPNRSAPAISARYTSPLKVFEAMAAGLPLVVSDLPSLREILRDEEAVFVPPDDPEALAAGLEELVAHPERRSRQATALRERSTEFTFDARARRILDWMESRT